MQLLLQLAITMTSVEGGGLCSWLVTAYILADADWTVQHAFICRLE